MAVTITIRISEKHFGSKYKPEFCWKDSVVVIGVKGVVSFICIADGNTFDIVVPVNKQITKSMPNKKNGEFMLCKAIVHLEPVGKKEGGVKKITLIEECVRIVALEKWFVQPAHNQPHGSVLRRLPRNNVG